MNVKEGTGKDLKPTICGYLLSAMVPLYLPPQQYGPLLAIQSIQASWASSPQIFTLALRGGQQPQSQRSQKQLSPQWISHFPKPLLFYLHLQHHDKMSARSHSKSHRISKTQVHHECSPPQWIALIALDLSRENNPWARAFGLSFYPQKWTYWCSQRSGCYFKEVISLWGSDKGIFVPYVFFQVWNGLCDFNSFTTEAKHEVTSPSESSSIPLIEKSKGQDRFLKEDLLNIFIHSNKLHFHEFSFHSSILLHWSRLCDWGHRQRTCGSIHPLKAFSKT